MEGFSKIFHAVNLEVVCMTSTPVIIMENFDENPFLQRFLSVKLGESKLILIKENVKYTD